MQRRFLCILNCAGLLCTACNNTPVMDEPPEIPPKSTLVIDFSDFNGRQAAGDLLPIEHFGWAVVDLGVWNVLVTVTMAIPVAAFVESFNHAPMQMPDASWSWTYDVEVAGIMHTAQLNATGTTSAVNWEMRLSKEGEYSNFVWFTGVSNLPLTEGSWTLNNNPVDGTPLLHIGWQRDTQSDAAVVRYTNTVAGGEENGSYIEYGVTAPGLYDAFYEISSTSSGNTISIEWLRATKQGRIIDENHFGDPEWRCWNQDYQDVECAE